MRGWLHDVDGNMHVTEEGQIVSEQVEALTNNYFYAPWLQWGSDEAEELSALVAQLVQELKDLETGENRSRSSQVR